MVSDKQLSRLSGILLLLVLVSSIIAAGLASGVDPVDSYNVPPDRVADVLQRVAENKDQHMAEIGFDLLSYVFTVALAGVLYVTFSPKNRLLALLGTLGLTSGGVILAAHDIPHFVLPWIAEEFVSASGAEAVALQNAGTVVLMTAMWGLSVGITFLGLGILLYGILLVKSKSVPPILGWLGVIAGILITFGVWLPRFDVTLYPTFVILASPVGIWQLGLGIWLTIKGAK